jgi:hypothetical protein
VKQGSHQDNRARGPLFHAYNLLDGRLWLLDVLGIAAASGLARAWLIRDRSRATGDVDQLSQVPVVCIGSASYADAVGCEAAHAIRTNRPPATSVRTAKLNILAMISPIVPGHS